MFKMKKRRFGFFGCALPAAVWFLAALSSQAAAISWTNLNGGNWSDATSWSPNSVPSTNDDAFITNRGIYDVSLDISPTVNSLTMGARHGAQTLHTGTSVLTVNNSTVIGTNAVFDLEGGSFFGPGPMAVFGSFLWTGGFVGGGGPDATVSVATNGTMVLEGQTYTLYGIITNAGMMVLEGGSLSMLGACYDNYGMLINLTNGVVDFEGDANIQALCGTEVMTNFGTVLKSGGAATSAIAVPFYNYGILDVENGTVSLADTYSLTNGTVNIGIGGTNFFGVLDLSGDPAQLSGGFTASLIGSYQPIATNVFPVVTYISNSGAFVTTNLPYLDAWATNYTSSNFSLIVLNARPIFPAVSNQTVNELAALSLSPSATDADEPPQTLTYSLSNAPAGMAIDPTNGAITWTPAQTQSPSTNLVTVSVTDNGTPPLSTNNSFQVVVVEVNVAPVLPDLGIQTVNDLALLTVSNTATDSNIHATITGYGLLEAPAGAQISSNGVFTWTPSESEGPSTNTITLLVSDRDPFDTNNPILTTTGSFTVIVYSLSLAPISNITTSVGQTVIFTNVVTDNDPTRLLTFSLTNAPASAHIGTATGIFVWYVDGDYLGTTNTFTVRVTDNSVPPLSATETFLVSVPQSPSNAVLTDPAFSNGQFQCQVHGPAGAEYIVQATGALTGEWTPLQTNTPATTPFIFTDTNSILTNRFYRVQVNP
jgi:hypothetical protein